MGPDPIAELEGELVEMWRRGGARFREQAHEIDPRLDASYLPVLVLLSRFDEAVPTSTLIATLGVGKSTLSRQVDALTRLGLARRIPDPSDARARLVELTVDGRARLAAQREAQVAHWRKVLGAWDPADLRTLSALLRRLGREVG